LKKKYRRFVNHQWGFAFKQRGLLSKAKPPIVIQDGLKYVFKYHFTSTVNNLPPFQKQKRGDGFELLLLSPPPFRFSEGGKIASKVDSND